MKSGKERLGTGDTGPIVDEWGVPTMFFGPHSEAFWGGMGRVATLSALLEDRLIALLASLRRQAFDAAPPPGLGALLSQLGAEYRARAEITAWVDFGEYLARVRRCVTYRNDLVHSLWPVQPGGRILFGHRLRSVPRDHRTADGPVAERRLVTTTMDELQSVVTELVALADGDFRRWYSLANAPASSPSTQGDVG